MRPLVPPPYRGEHGNVPPRREIGGGSGPDIGMDGSKRDERAPRITVKPTACVSQSRRFVIVIPVLLVDAILESPPAFEGRLHREAQSIRLIAAPCSPSPIGRAHVCTPVTTATLVCR